MGNKLLLVSVMVVVLMVSLLAACAAPAPTPAPVPLPLRHQSTPAPTPAPAPAPPPAQPTEVVKWIYQSKNPGTQPYNQVTIKAFKELEIISGGRFKITFHEPGSIVEPYVGEWDGIQEGLLDGAQTEPGANRKAFGDVSDLYGQYTSGPNPIEHLAWYMVGDGVPLLQELIDRTPGYDNLLYLMPIAAKPAENEMWTNKEINKLEDYDGLKMRSFGAWGRIISDIGASVVTLPAGEVYQALERGVIDATEIGSPSTDWAYGLHEVAKYVYQPGVHATDAMTLQMWNKKSYNALPDDLKLMFLTVIRSALLENTISYTWLDAQAMKQIKEYGTDVRTLSIEIQAYITQKGDELWEGMAAEDEFFAKVYHNQKDFYKQYREITDKLQPDVGMLLEYGK